ncbi:MAG: cysteine--tRNA ligase [Cyclobacteriaceae bacterium]|nr:cysteine--tRNA ligase [Cyclobacteriaceae bacterium]UYN88265.1 MAG: cysteine--tRNA ligase [Cyclobacteriaceae bacterium]
MSLFEKYPVSITNSLSGKKEVFTPLKSPFVGLYSCGPTVYNEVHLGNLRTFSAFDVVYRYLTHIGYKVRYVRNITDAGHLTNDAGEGVDRIEESAKLEQLEPMEIVQKYTFSFHEVCRIFNILPPSIEPTATGHIVEQIEMVKKILANGYAYEVNGSVYFDVRKFMEKYKYGELSGRNIDELLEGTRELDRQDEKRHAVDFAIWKAVSPNHIQRWPSPWGEGIPGWHLECSAMGTKYLGEQFDIHGGGMDLKFPHHECEIAQSIGAYGKAPVRYWMHANMLTVNGEKMSKSKGNSFLPRELFTGTHPLLAKAYSPMAVRFFMLQSHYSSTLDFSNEALQAAEKGYKKLSNALSTIKKLEHPGGGGKQDEELLKLIDEAYRNMSDDFNTAKTLAVLFEMSSRINDIKSGNYKLTDVDVDTFQKFKSAYITFMEDVLGLQEEGNQNQKLLDGVIRVMIELRKKARTDRNYALSDKIRDDLKALGVQLMDGKDGEITYTIE